MHNLISNQENYKNAIIIEAGGHGFAYSLNYERVLAEAEKIKVTAQIGAAYYGESNGLIPLKIPISFNQMFRVANYQYIETGFGKMVQDDGVQISRTEVDNNYTFNTWIFRVGYRLHSKNEKWLFRVAYTPILQDRNEYIHWAGLSVGYRF